MTLTNDDRSGAPRRVRTDRLDLCAVGRADLAPLHVINHDPRTWSHAPEGRHLDEGTTRAWIERAVDVWESDGMGYWTARLGGADGPVIGIGGASFQRATGYWNLYYRLDPAHWGRGYATELARAAVDAAHRHAPDRPVAAWVHDHNAGSRAVVERLGLADLGLRPHPSLGEPVRLFADRPIPFVDPERPGPE
ncbi:GNAT family N-acetyltransferase [Kitasatospora aureofaciens]|uniref:GNAT family N-acetyltransferase n=1 Tax=Kitasatospora aureofaciens TaxID=1894 RepID=UPI001C45FA12|nr:GNAT family N-acetyltransferase [Kitasatospora aureofaciens]MBV6698872.1 GNAT family N-acetyltransferase [Kitasatospora aureofaciens]